MQKARGLLLPSYRCLAGGLAVGPPSPRYPHTVPGASSVGSLAALAACKGSRPISSSFAATSGWGVLVPAGLGRSFSVSSPSQHDQLDLSLQKEGQAGQNSHTLPRACPRRVLHSGCTAGEVGCPGVTAICGQQRCLPTGLGLLDPEARPVLGACGHQLPSLLGTSPVLGRRPRGLSDTLHGLCHVHPGSLGRLASDRTWGAGANF